MPKDLIDYSKTIIYKICCLDKWVLDVYVGHTTNFTKRKYQHKLSCNNTDNQLKIYKIIRENGGWNNWEMIEIATYNCKNQTEARIKEQEHYQQLNATQNSCPPFIYKKDVFCNECIIQFSSPNELKLHLAKGHDFMVPNFADISEPNNSGIFVCKICDYSTSRKSQYGRHLITLKHKYRTNVYPKDLPQIKTHDCVCGKTFSHRQSLFKHKKSCKPICEQIIEVKPDPPAITTEVVMQLIKQNQELQNLLIEQNNKMYELAKEGKTINNNNTTNNNNNNFNLNVFLNEKCKDALNLMDFVDSLAVKLKDLENTARLGYVEGISQIFITGLSELNVHKRPIHCSDFKREILYIKDHDSWEKEDEDKTKITNAIKIIGSKNMKQITEWQKANPHYNDPESKQNDKYMKMICNAMSGSSKEESDKNYEKIIKNIAKETIIDKSV
jgi:hypothetical protein